MAAQEKALANKANKQCQAAAQEKALADEANKQHWATAWDKALADKANEQHRHEAATASSTPCSGTPSQVPPSTTSFTNGNVARQLEAYAAPLFARVDAIMAEIRAMDGGFGNWAAFGDELLVKEDNEASAPMMPPSAPPTVVSSPPHRPKSYVDAVFSNMGGSSQATSLTLAPAALPSPAINGQLRMARRRARP